MWFLGSIVCEEFAYKTTKQCMLFYILFFCFHFLNTNWWRKKKQQQLDDKKREIEFKMCCISVYPFLLLLLLLLRGFDRSNTQNEPYFAVIQCCCYASSIRSITHARSSGVTRVRFLFEQSFVRNEQEVTFATCCLRILAYKLLFVLKYSYKIWIQTNYKPANWTQAEQQINGLNEWKYWLLIDLYW